MGTRNPDVILSEIAENKKAIAKEDSEIKEIEKTKAGRLKDRKALEDKARALQAELSASRKSFEKELRNKYERLLCDTHAGVITPPYSLTHTFIKIEVKSYGKVMYYYYPVLNPGKKDKVVQNKDYKDDDYCICVLKDSVVQRALEESLKKGGAQIYNAGTSEKPNDCPVFKQSRIIYAYLFYLGRGLDDEEAFYKARMIVAFVDAKMRGRGIISAIYELEKPYAEKGSD